MAGGMGKVSEWIRKRTMPRRSSSKAKAAAAAEAESSGGSRAPAPTRRKLRARVFPSALRWRPGVHVLAVLYEKVVYHLLWLVESVVVVARLCFFVMRFGFKQL